MIQNPILRGFCPDPSIIRAGEDFYIATSTFEWWPGVRIHHSRDLKNWEQIPSPLNRLSQLNMLGVPTSGGVWAPCLSYDGARFWLVFTDVKTKKGMYYNTHNYLVNTDDIYGTWSEPVYLNSVGFDPSLFHDNDGKKYLINMLNGFKGITVQEYDPISSCLTGPVEMVFGGTEAGFTEGPHMYHVGDWYYLLTAEGGTGYGHQITMARSKSIWGPFETDPDGPVLTSDPLNEKELQKAGHGDFVDTGHGEWYLVHLCGRARSTGDGRKVNSVGHPDNTCSTGGRTLGNKVCLTGRETAIQKVCFEDGWLRMADGGFYARTEVMEPSGIKECPLLPVNSGKDDFNSGILGIRYSCPRMPLESNADLNARPGWLRLYGQESLNSLHHVSLLAVRQEEVYARAETAMEYEPDRYEQAAGLAYMYDAMNFYLFVKTRLETGETVLRIIGSDTGNCRYLWEAAIVPEKGLLKLRAETDITGAAVCFYYCEAGQSPSSSAQMGESGEIWHQVGEAYTTEILTDEHCRGFTGAHFGVYCHDLSGYRKYADFDYFLYENIKDSGTE